MLQSPIIIKLGGSLVVPKDIDIVFLRKFCRFIEKLTAQNQRFIIIVGGGYTNRWYRDQAMRAGVKDVTDLHWIGTVATQLNAELVRSVFGNIAHSRVYSNYKKTIEWKKPVLVVGGYEPGHSTDNDAVIMARKFKAKTVINMTNVDSLFSKDPKKFPDAVAIREITWRDFRALFGNPVKHEPGQNIPIDAIAALQSQKYKIETFYIGGNNLNNLKKVLEGGRWHGTRIYSDS